MRGQWHRVQDFRGQWHRVLGFLLINLPMVTALATISNSLDGCPLLECSGLCAERAEEEGSRSLYFLR